MDPREEKYRARKRRQAERRLAVDAEWLARKGYKLVPAESKMDVVPAESDRPAKRARAASASS